MGTLKKEPQENEPDLSPKHLSILKEILRQFAPGHLVWAYGSRVKGTSKKSSDLDLVAFGLDSRNISQLKEAFEESDLPFRVDLMDWGSIPESFRENIRERYVVVQDGGGGSASLTRHG